LSSPRAGWGKRVLFDPNGLYRAYPATRTRILSSCSDGDILNEIINQKPCVLGVGGKDAVAALILYAIVMVMVCCLPKADPYGLCFRKDREPVRSFDPVGDGASPGGGKLGIFGSSKKGNSDAEKGNTARSGREHDRPNWLSEEEARDRDHEENEII
jgi:hypothetical protein